MATQAIEKMRYSCGPRKVKYYEEDASETFKKGELVYLDSDGQLVVCSSDATTILGMALTDATGTAGTKIPVLIAQDGTEFEANVYHATAASAVTEWGEVDNKYAYYATGNIGYVDIGDTDNDALLITEILTGGGKSEGDTYGRVRFVVIPAAQQMGATAT